MRAIFFAAAMLSGQPNRLLSAQIPADELSLFASIVNAGTHDATTILGWRPGQDSLFINETSMIAHASMLVGSPVSSEALDALITVPHRLTGIDQARRGAFPKTGVRTTNVYLELNALIPLPDGTFEAAWTLLWKPKHTPQGLGKRVTRAWFRQDPQGWSVVRTEIIMQT